MAERGWKPLDVYAHGGPAPDATSRYTNRKRGLVAEPRVIRTLRKYEKAFSLPEGYFLEEQLYRLAVERIIVYPRPAPTRIEVVWR